MLAVWNDDCHLGFGGEAPADIVPAHRVFEADLGGQAAPRQVVGKAAAAGLGGVRLVGVCGGGGTAGLAPVIKNLGDVCDVGRVRNLGEPQHKIIVLGAVIGRPQAAKLAQMQPFDQQQVTDVIIGKQQTV